MPRVEVKPDNGDRGAGPESLKPCNNTFPNRSIKAVGIPEVTAGVPAIEPSEPAGPGSHSIRMNFGKELGQQRIVLSWNGQDPQASIVLGLTDVNPGDFALSPRAGFFDRQSRGRFCTFYQWRQWPLGKQTVTHGMRNHSSEDRVNQKKLTADGEGATTPSGELEITFWDDGGKVRGSNLRGREGGSPNRFKGRKRRRNWRQKPFGWKDQRPQKVLLW